MSACLAFLQKSPTVAPKIVGIFFTFRNEVFVETEHNILPCTQILINEHNDIITPTSDSYLKQLEKISTMSEVSYFYTEDENLIEEYRAVLRKENLFNAG